MSLRMGRRNPCHRLMLGAPRDRHERRNTPNPPSRRQQKKGAGPERKGQGLRPTPPPAGVSSVRPLDFPSSPSNCGGLGFFPGPVRSRSPSARSWPCCMLLVPAVSRRPGRAAQGTARRSPPAPAQPGPASRRAVSQPPVRATPARHRGQHSGAKAGDRLMAR